jgi:transcriptional regulator of met regulon
MMLIIMGVKRAARRRADRLRIAETRAAAADAFFRAHACKPLPGHDKPLRRFV